MEMPDSRFSFFKRANIWAWMVTSRAVVGSSGSSSLGPGHDGGGDHGPLQHSAGELVGILAIHARRVRQLHCRQGRQGPLPPRLPGRGLCGPAAPPPPAGRYASGGPCSSAAPETPRRSPCPGPAAAALRPCVEQLRAVQQDAPRKSRLLRGSSPATIMAVTVLPEPDSPTSPRISPSWMVRDTPVRPRGRGVELHMQDLGSPAWATSPVSSAAGPRR